MIQSTSKAPAFFIGPAAGIYFFILSSTLLWTYMPRYLALLGLSGVAIGGLLATNSLLQTVFTPVWGIAADRWQHTRFLIRTQLFLGMLAMCALPFLHTYPWIFLLVCVYAVTTNCAISLVDVVTLSGVGPTNYGKVRAWGSIGYGTFALAAAVGGWYLSYDELAKTVPFALVVAGIGAFLAALKLQQTRAELTRPTKSDTLSLLRRPALLLALVIGAAHWAAQAPYNMFLVFLSEERSFGAWVPGLAILAGIVAEVIALSAGRRLLHHLSPYKLLFVCLLITGFRWLFTGHATSPLMLIAVQTIHGVSFGAFLVAMMAIIARETPANLRGTGQSLFYLVVFGIGGGCGNFVAGWAMDYFSAAEVFIGAGTFELIIFAGCLPFYKRLIRTDAATQRGL